MAAPSYVRAVLTASCPLSCRYCHMEGDRPSPSGCRELDADQWVSVLGAAVRAGIRKVKLLGGEPFRRKDLDRIIAGVRAVDPGVDLSVITSGVVDPDRLDTALAAGLSRTNVSIHGFGQEAFSGRGGTPGMWRLRGAFLERVLSAGRPTKLNFVYGGPDDAHDLGELLCWAAGRPVVVGVLDDLSRPDLTPEAVEQAVVALRGAPARVVVDPDPCSLPTRHLCWGDGLRVEIKDQHLGHVAPWGACATCPVRSACREGTHAIRISRSGLVRACMDRTDLAVPLAPALDSRDPGAVDRTWREAVRALEGAAPACQEIRPPAFPLSTGRIAGGGEMARCVEC